MPKVSDAYLAARRRQILDAAATCFARDGFHRTSMQDIVRESGISAGLVYRYFTGKDDVIAAIVTEWNEQRSDFLSTDGHAQRTNAYLAYLSAVAGADARNRLGVQVWAEALRSTEIRDLALRNVDGPRAATAEALRHVPLPPGADPDALARILIAIYQGLVLQTAWDPDLDNPAYVRTVAALLTAITADDG